MNLANVTLFKPIKGAYPPLVFKAFWEPTKLATPCLVSLCEDCLCFLCLWRRDCCKQALWEANLILASLPWGLNHPFEVLWHHFGCPKPLDGRHTPHYSPTIFILYCSYGNGIQVFLIYASVVAWFVSGFYITNLYAKSPDSLWCNNLLN